MAILTVSEARANLYQLVHQVHLTHEPMVIKGKKNSAVLIAEDDWRSIQETLFLLAIPAMRQSIQEGLATPLEETSKNLEW